MGFLRTIFGRRDRSREARREATFEGPAGPQGGPGESGPSEPGYEGRVTLGDEGAAPDSLPDEGRRTE